MTQAARASGGDGWVIGVPRSAATIERGEVGLGQRGAGLQAFDQVGVADEGTAESEQVCLALIEPGGGEFQVVAVVGR